VGFPAPPSDNECNYTVLSSPEQLSPSPSLPHPLSLTLSPSPSFTHPLSLTLSHSPSLTHPFSLTLLPHKYRRYHLLSQNAPPRSLANRWGRAMAEGTSTLTLTRFFLCFLCFYRLGRGNGIGSTNIHRCLCVPCRKLTRACATSPHTPLCSRHSQAPSPALRETGREKERESLLTLLRSYISLNYMNYY
jgi:hypothetical protein